MWRDQRCLEWQRCEERKGVSMSPTHGCNESPCPICQPGVIGNTRGPIEGDMWFKEGRILRWTDGEWTEISQVKIPTIKISVDEYHQIITTLERLRYALDQRQDWIQAAPAHVYKLMEDALQAADDLKISVGLPGSPPQSGEIQGCTRSHRHPGSCNGTPRPDCGKGIRGVAEGK